MLLRKGILFGVSQLAATLSTIEYGAARTNPSAQFEVWRALYFLSLPVESGGRQPHSKESLAPLGASALHESKNPA